MKKVLKGRVRSLRLTPEAEANALAGEILQELFYAVGTKETYGLRDGDYLDDVMEQEFHRSGMGEEVRKMGTAQLIINLCLDVSGSMWGYERFSVVGSYVFWLLWKALSHVRDDVGPGILNFNLYLWAARESTVYDLSSDNVYFGWMGEVKGQHVGDLTTTPQSIDLCLKALAEKTVPMFRGGTTTLSPLMKTISDWELQNAKAEAQKLDIIVTDGAIQREIVSWGSPPRNDYDDVRKYQEARQGCVRSVILRLKPREEWVTDWSEQFPQGFAHYPTNPFSLRADVRRLVSDFFSEIATAPRR